MTVIGISKFSLTSRYFSQKLYVELELTSTIFELIETFKKY